MNKIVNKVLLTGEKFIPKFCLRLLGIIYSTCRPFNKDREKIQKSKRTQN